MKDPITAAIDMLTEECALCDTMAGRLACRLVMLSAAVFAVSFLGTLGVELATAVIS